MLTVGGGVVTQRAAELTAAQPGTMLALWMRCRPKLDDDAIADPDIGLEGGPPGAVDDPAAAEKQVVLQHLRFPGFLGCKKVLRTTTTIHRRPTRSPPDLHASDRCLDDFIELSNYKQPSPHTSGEVTRSTQHWSILAFQQ